MLKQYYKNIVFNLIIIINKKINLQKSFINLIILIVIHINIV